MSEPQSQDQIDALMKALAGGEVPVEEPPAAKPSSAVRAAPPPRPVGPLRKAEYEALGASPSGPRSEAGLEFLGDVDVRVRVELGKTNLNVQDVLRLNTGSVVALDSLVGDPVNVYVNDRLVARGEVLVVDDKFAVRITEVVPAPKAQ